MYGLLSGLAFTVATAMGRHDVLTFDYGWRFHLGDPSAPSPTPGPGPAPVPPACKDVSKAFPVDASGFAWYGLHYQSAKDSKSCAQACCKDTTCWTWQFSAQLGCWVGIPNGKRNDTSWKGGARNSTIPPRPPSPAPDTPAGLPINPAAAKVNYDDSKWRLLDLPHDYVVEQAYNANVPSDQGPGRPKGGAGQSYLPRNVSYYRKHFNLPADWKGNAVWIYFEGVFRITKMWLNGVPLREHAAYKGDGRHACSFLLSAFRSLPSAHRSRRMRVRDRETGSVRERTRGRAEEGEEGERKGGTGEKVEIWVALCAYLYARMSCAFAGCTHSLTQCASLICELHSLDSLR